MLSVVTNIRWLWIGKCELVPASAWSIPERVQVACLPLPSLASILIGFMLCYVAWCCIAFDRKACLVRR
jgi:hypothetical protein